MAWWVYKCSKQNIKRHGNGYAGDWRDFFDDRASKKGSGKRWGELDVVPKLIDLKAGDTVIAYQSIRNVILGITTVVKITRDGGLFLKNNERFTVGVKVRPLKAKYERIARMDAWQQGPIKTVYEITANDAKFVLDAARKVLRRVNNCCRDPRP